MLLDFRSRFICFSFPSVRVRSCCTLAFPSWSRLVGFFVLSFSPSSIALFLISVSHVLVLSLSPLALSTSLAGAGSIALGTDPLAPTTLDHFDSIGPERTVLAQESDPFPPREVIYALPFSQLVFRHRFDEFSVPRHFLDGQARPGTHDLFDRILRGTEPVSDVASSSQLPAPELNVILVELFPRAGVHRHISIGAIANTSGVTGVTARNFGRAFHR